MDETKLQKLKQILELADKDYVASSDFVAIITIILDGVSIFREEISKSVKTSDVAFTKKIDNFIGICERQLQNITKISNKTNQDFSSFQKDIKSRISEFEQIINDIELQKGDKGDKGEDAEITEGMIDEMVRAVLIKFKKEYDPKFKKEIQDAIKEAIKDIQPNTTIIQSGLDSGAPFEMTLKQGTGISIRRDASGAYVISSTGGSGGTSAINEVVAGAGTSWTLAQTPLIDANVAVYGGGSRLTPTADFTISGTTITTTNSYDAGQVLADYSY